jgi:predicted nucleotidyltransferase
MHPIPTHSDQTAIPIPLGAIASFCDRWGITEFALFGSILRDDFGPASDIDVLIRYRPEVGYSLSKWLEMQDELEHIFGRKVDLVSRRGLEASRNRHRKESILKSARVIHAA